MAVKHSPAIIRMYMRLIKAGRKTIDEVPERYRDEVRTALDETCAPFDE